MDETLSKEDPNSRHNNDSDQHQEHEQEQSEQHHHQSQLHHHRQQHEHSSSVEVQQNDLSKHQENSPPEDLLSNKRWGTTPIRQDTPWELPPAPEPPKSDLFNRFAHAGANSHAPLGMQPGGDFARAPGPASSILDANAMTSKPFGMNQRASTWSSFGTPPGSTDGDQEWPKSSRAGMAAGGNSLQTSSNAFDLVHEFEPGKPWHGPNLMKSLDGESPITIGQPSMSAAFPGAYGLSSVSRSPTGNQFESSGIGTWSPIVKGGRSGSLWDGDGQDGGRGEGGRFDDGTAIWGNPVQTKAVGAQWDKTGGDGGALNDKSRSSNMAGNNQSTYRLQQSSSSSANLLMSSNTSPSNQQNRNQQQILNKSSTISHNFDQVQQSNALSNQAIQPNRGMGLSSNVPSKHQHQLTTMVQQIQLAVQAGHLNPQILNQPLAPVTLQLLYQLLQQIRSLQQLQMKLNQPGTHQSACGVQISKTKQTIQNLQNQIAAQQSMHLKQTQAHNISSRQPTMPNIAAGGMGGNLGPALPPGISQSGDSFRLGNMVGDFHGQAMHANNFGADSMTHNGLATSLSHMNLGGAGMMPTSRFDQPWRAPASKQHQSTMGPSAFTNHNLMNAAPGGMQKSMLNPSSGNGGSSFIGVQQGGEFARAPGPASSMVDNNMAPKSFGMTNRSASTWSAFGNSSSNDSEPEWPKSTTSRISSGNSTQSSNAFDLVPEFEPGKPWRGSMLMRSVEDDPTMTPGSMARSLAPQRKTIWSDEVL